MYHHPKHIILFFAIFFSTFLNAQLDGSQNFTIDEGGKNVRFLSLCLDKSGFLLAGTSNGLYRYDGVSFYKFPFSDTVENTSVTAIAQDKSGKTWLGFDNGKIGFIDKNRISLLQTSEPQPTEAINHIFIDSSSVVYFATAGEGIYFYRQKKLFHINTKNGLSDGYVYKLAGDDKELLAATDKGINIIRWKAGMPVVTTFTSLNGLPDNIVRCIYQKQNLQNRNKLWWVGMHDKGLGLFDYKTGQKRFEDIGLTRLGQVNSILSDNNEMLVATASDGIFSIRYNDSIIRSVQQFSSKANSASDLVKDNEGNIWYTTKTELHKTNGTQLKMILPFTKEMFEDVHAILVDENESIWINSNDGLEQYIFNYSLAKWNVNKYRLPGISSKTDITSLFQDKFGHIWAGTFGKGVIIFDPSTKKHRSIQEDDLLVNGSVISISGNKDQVWISSLGGAVLCKLTESNRDINKTYSFENFSKVKDIGSNYIYSTLVDSKGRVWFATDGKGITVLANGKFTNYSHSHGIKSNVVYNICEDKLGNIWFSTLDGGIYKFDGNSFANISIEDGLLNPTITAMGVDGKGNIVAVCSKGINLINPVTNQVSYFDNKQGIEDMNTDLNCISSQNGSVYFITRKGVHRFQPSFVSLQPGLSLLQVQLFLEDIDPNSQKHFFYDQNNFTFSYSGISFSHPEKVRYQYILEGFGKEWTITKDNAINFPKLPPGSYTFKIRASLNDNFSNAEIVSYSFAISKPFWWQWWFIVSSFIVAGFFVYLYMKAREKRLKRIDRVEKEKIQSQFETLKSQVNPHFLFNSFNTLISVIEENPHLAVEYVEHLSDLYRKIVTYRDKDLITLNEELNLINDYFFIQKKRFGQNLQLVQNISSEQKQNWLIAPLTLQMLCENAVKHNSISADTKLVIELSIEDGLLLVKNNINRKLTQEKGEGMGLQNIQKRYKLLEKRVIRIEKTEIYFIVYIPLIELTA